MPVDYADNLNRRVQMLLQKAQGAGGQTIGQNFASPSTQGTTDFGKLLNSPSAAMGSSNPLMPPGGDSPGDQIPPPVLPPPHDPQGHGAEIFRRLSQFFPLPRQSTNLWSLIPRGRY